MKVDQLPFQYTSYSIFSMHFWCAVFVLVLYPATSNWEVSPEIPVARCLCLIVSRWLAVAGLPPLMDVGCRRGPSAALGRLVESEGDLSRAPVGLDTMARTSILGLPVPCLILRHLLIRQNGGNA